MTGWPVFVVCIAVGVFGLGVASLAQTSRIDALEDELHATKLQVCWLYTGGPDSGEACLIDLRIREP